MDSILSDMRRRALEMREKTYANTESTEQDKKTADDIVEFICVEDCFRRVSRSTVFAIFSYLDYFPGEKFRTARFNEMYYKVMEEVDRKYILIDPEQWDELKRK